MYKYSILDKCQSDRIENISTSQSVSKSMDIFYILVYRSIYKRDERVKLSDLHANSFKYTHVSLHTVRYGTVTLCIIY